MKKVIQGIAIDLAYSATLVSGFIYGSEIAYNIAVFATWVFFVLSIFAFFFAGAIAEGMAEKGEGRTLPVWWHVATWTVVFGALLPGGHFLLASISLFRLLISEVIYSKINDCVEAKKTNF